jgi:hypothetical protein
MAYSALLGQMSLIEFSLLGVKFYDIMGRQKRPLAVVRPEGVLLIASNQAFGTIYIDAARSILMEYWNVGDRAFAYWEADEYYYPATITQIEDENIYIRYDTGEEEWTSADYLEEMAVAPGDWVESKWSEDDDYYSAEVLTVSGNQLQVRYEDGTEEWTSLDNLRTWYEE